MDICIIFHSGYGHTKAQAEAIAVGVSQNKQARIHTISVDDLENNWELLDNADALIFGCPTYMGTISAEFKKFMDESSSRWMQRSWHNKLSAGFTNSASLSGDKQNTLLTLANFAAQHGMIWVGQDQIGPGVGLPDPSTAINRMGGFIGLMAQSDSGSSPERTPPQGDLNTAILFGKRIADLTERFQLNYFSEQEAEQAYV